jgi:hypothetical protein
MLGCACVSAVGGMFIGQAGQRLPQRVLGLSQELPFSWQVELSVTVRGSVSKFQLSGSPEAAADYPSVLKTAYWNFWLKWGVRSMMIQSHSYLA